MNVGKIKDMIKKAKQALSRGDTLIEVLIAIAVMAVVISGIYAIAHRNLRTAEASQQRNQALALAQGQVEFMRSAAANQSLSAYTSQAPFCINDGSVSFTDSSLTKYNGSGTAIPADTKDFSANDQKTYCLFSTNPQLYISDTYTTTGIFQVTVAYPSPTGRLTSVNSSDNYDTVQLFYRPPIYSNSDLTIGTDKPTGTIVVKGDTNGTVVNVIINRASGFSDSVDLSVSSGLPTDGRVQASFGTPNPIDSSAKSVKLTLKADSHARTNSYILTIVAKSDVQGNDTQATTKLPIKVKTSGGGVGVGVCTCNNGSSCPGGDASQCPPPGGQCICGNNQPCPGGQSSNCPSPVGGNDPCPPTCHPFSGTEGHVWVSIPDLEPCHYTSTGNSC